MELAIVAGEISRRASATVSVDKLESLGAAAVYRCDLGAQFRRLHSLRKNSVLHLILGGAAVYRCDNWLIFIDGFKPLRARLTVLNQFHWASRGVPSERAAH